MNKEQILAAADKFMRVPFLSGNVISDIEGATEAINEYSPIIEEGERMISNGEEIDDLGLSYIDECKEIVKCAWDKLTKVVERLTELYPALV